MKLAHAAVAAAAPEHHERLLAALLPVLVALLDASPTAAAGLGPAARSVRELSLQTLNQIGPAFPAAFRAVMGANPTLRERLGEAIKASAQQAKSQAGSSSSSSGSSSAAAARSAAPKIQLTMNFSGFQG